MMPTASAQPQYPANPAPSARSRRAGRPFLGLIDAVIVESPAAFDFDGALSREHATAIWTWMTRDLAPDLIDTDAPESDAVRLALDANMGEILGRARQALAAAPTSYEAERRLKTQVGGEIVWGRLPMAINALKCRNLLEKAQAFGRAANGMQDEAGLALALQSMPLNDQGVAALLMMAAVGQVANPSKLTAAVIRIAGSPAEAAIQRAGFAPLIDAMLAHAQNQTHLLGDNSAYSDVDLTCRAIDRYHRLSRAVGGYLELARSSRWSQVVAGLTKAVSERVEPRLRDVAGSVNMALRRGREGSDRLDSDQILVALNGVYVLAAVRDARDSLGVNAIFDQAWSQVGQALETHIQRGLEILRQNPADKISSARLDAAIKMAELRFNPDYAETLRKAKESAERPRPAAS